MLSSRLLEGIAFFALHYFPWAVSSHLLLLCCDTIWKSIVLLLSESWPTVSDEKNGLGKQQEWMIGHVGFLLSKVACFLTNHSCHVNDSSLPRLLWVSPFPSEIFCSESKSSFPKSVFRYSSTSKKHEHLGTTQVRNSTDMNQNMEWPSARWLILIKRDIQLRFISKWSKI